MGKALVLGGGGSVGTAWQTGLIAGWNRRGIVLTDADLILGTSAGAAVGVQVALGHDLDRQLDRYRAARRRHLAGGRTAVMEFDEEQARRVDELFARGTADGRRDPAVRRDICRAALEIRRSRRTTSCARSSTSRAGRGRRTMSAPRSTSRRRSSRRSTTRSGESWTAASRRRSPSPASTRRSPSRDAATSTAAACRPTTSTWPRATSGSCSSR